MALRVPIKLSDAQLSQARAAAAAGNADAIALLAQVDPGGTLTATFSGGLGSKISSAVQTVAKPVIATAAAGLTGGASIALAPRSSTFGVKPAVQGYAAGAAIGLAAGAAAGTIGASAGTVAKAAVPVAAGAAGKLAGMEQPPGKPPVSPSAPSVGPASGAPTVQGPGLFARLYALAFPR